MCYVVVYQLKGYQQVSSNFLAQETKWCTVHKTWKPETHHGRVPTFFSRIWNLIEILMHDFSSLRTSYIFFLNWWGRFTSTSRDVHPTWKVNFHCWKKKKYVVDLDVLIFWSNKHMTHTQFMISNQLNNVQVVRCCHCGWGCMTSPFTIFISAHYIRF